MSVTYDCLFYWSFLYLLTLFVIIHVPVIYTVQRLGRDGYKAVGKFDSIEIERGSVVIVIWKH